MTGAARPSTCPLPPTRSSSCWTPWGSVAANPSRVVLAQYPDPAPAVENARANGRDLRTVSLGGVPVRLLTLPLLSGEDGGAADPAGFVQAGFVMTLHDQQVTSLISAVIGAGLLGLIGAALVTAVVTARALAPVRAAFARERRFVADASHELRTPVALVHASAEVLQREDLVRADGRPLVDDILAESGRLGRLVGDLLTLAASDAHALTVERAPLDLAELARDTVRRATPLAGERGLALVLGCPRGWPHCRCSGDRDRLDAAPPGPPRQRVFPFASWRDGQGCGRSRRWQRPSRRVRPGARRRPRRSRADLRAVRPVGRDSRPRPRRNGPRARHREGDRRAAPGDHRCRRCARRWRAVRRGYSAGVASPRNQSSTTRSRR